MKSYITQPGENIGSIARKFGLPSWKYLYQINKDIIGENPDQLTEGTKLKIPLWDTTSGDEKIRAKGVDPFKYTGGIGYRYPWVPFRFSLQTTGEKISENFGEREIIIENSLTKKIIYKGTITPTEPVETLLPDVKEITIGIKGFPFILNGKKHTHPDDRKATQTTQEIANVDHDEDSIIKNI